MDESHAVSYIDFLTVTLTALCVILAALALFIGIAAIMGYRDIKDKAGEIAKKAAEAKIVEYFEKLSQRDSIREAMPPIAGEETADAADDHKPK
jgi:hypothetical protein